MLLLVILTCSASTLCDGIREMTLLAKINPVLDIHWKLISKEMEAK